MGTLRAVGSPRPSDRVSLRHLLTLSLTMSLPFGLCAAREIELYDPMSQSIIVTGCPGVRQTLPGPRDNEEPFQKKGAIVIFQKGRSPVPKVEGTAPSPRLGLVVGATSHVVCDQRQSSLPSRSLS